MCLLCGLLCRYRQFISTKKQSCSWVFLFLSQWPHSFSVLFLSASLETFSEGQRFNLAWTSIPRTDAFWGSFLSNVLVKPCLLILKIFQILVNIRVPFQHRNKACCTLFHNSDILRLCENISMLFYNLTNQSSQQADYTV